MTEQTETPPQEDAPELSPDALTTGTAAIVPATLDPRVIAPARAGQDLKVQLEQVEWLKKNVMIAEVHYGPPFPGSDKPTLLKPGGELLYSFFGLHPEFETVWSIRDFGQAGNEPLVAYEVKCRVFLNGTDVQVGEGGGSCSSWESKYRYREAKRRCPECGKETIIKGKAEYGGGWLCFRKLDGCGAKFQDGDPIIESQTVGQVPNDNIFDLFNTILKMAEKRALIQAILVATGASFLFTQDEELLEAAAIHQARQARQDAAITMTPTPTPPLDWVQDQPTDDEAAATQAADTRRPPDRQRVRSNTGASQKPTPRPPANNGDDQPWQEYIANWTQKDWGRYWQDMKETVGLTEDEVHEAIGNPLGEDGKPSVKAFTGTRGEKRALIRAAVEAKKTEQGAFTATRVYAKSVIGGKPLVKMYALDKRTRREDPLPMIVDEPVETATLREWFPATPKPLSVDEDGSLIYQHDPDSGVSVTVVYQQQGGHKTVKSVRFYEAPNTASE